jgi:hypothetical protein
MQEVCADKARLSNANLKTVVDNDEMPYSNNGRRRGFQARRFTSKEKRQLPRRLGVQWKAVAADGAFTDAAEVE